MPDLFKRKWLVLEILAILWLIGTGIYAWQFITVPEGSSHGFEATKFVFTSISAFGVLFSVLLTSFNSLEASLNVQDRIAFDRIENSFEYMRRWDSSALRDARDETRRIRKQQDRLSPDDIISRINSNDDLERSVITMFNFFEEIELSIQKDRVDKPSLQKAFGSLYVPIHDRFKTWIKTGSDSSQRQNLESLRDRWRPRAAPSDGQ